MNTYRHPDLFVERHNGLSPIDQKAMLEAVGFESLDLLINKTVPRHIRLNEELILEPEMSEYEFSAYINALAQKNIVAKSYIGQGYYPSITPAAILRNIFENPGWYTQYTPYQAEISQGRLEALFNFQSMVSELTGLPVANASLLDEATAAAESMLMLYSFTRATHKAAHCFMVADTVFPQTLDVIRTRAVPFAIEVKLLPLENILLDDSVFGVFIQNPDKNGSVADLTTVLQTIKHAGKFSVVATDIMSTLLIKSPGEMGADICVGSTQRFGIPMGFGGPHAAFYATKEEFKRMIPGRIIGASIDVNGNKAFRMALQTREQHIKREKATSNICTSQVLLAIMAGMYAMYHGPKRLKAIAQRIHDFTVLLNETLVHKDIKQVNKTFFDTLLFEFSNNAQFLNLKNLATAANVNFYYPAENMVEISLDETINAIKIKELITIFSTALEHKFDIGEVPQNRADFGETIKRISPVLEYPVFNSYHTETDFMRYVKKLENKDLSLTLSMIPLGSCTMKLNAAAELIPLSLPQFMDIHPFAPEHQVLGYQKVIDELGSALKVITGFQGVSFQPNSGAQGEYTGLMVIRNYFLSKGETHRNICLIPSSAHGTNPASAVMAGMKVIVVNCDERGNIDVSDLKIKAELHKENLAALMVTYPSTHGVFESAIIDICEIVHSFGGMVYMDGANMNAQVGLTSPARIGADVCHLNLHKTFAIPHGGGGPGMGPICVKEHLVKYLPEHVFTNNSPEHIGAVSAAPYGSALVLLISLSYIKMLGANGLKHSTMTAILNSNYLKAKLEPFYKVLYSGENGCVAHELIFDMREFKKTAGVEVEDIAKRLMDYGFHAPTVSFPVAGTLMVEPTESESKAELDRFIEAMISIKNEIAEIENGKFDQKNNVLKNAPHTVALVCSDNWQFPYSREQAAYPVVSLKEYKFWPSVGRVNNAYGDRNLICSCADIQSYT
ncbi:MAG: aminomethyl-transferring glycine dehydrogenase [Ignavibacteriales bacterium]|nr:aminomethyl-transferring glycine dehydrogenase [Ignavibacteriales bacterium]